MNITCATLVSALKSMTVAASVAVTGPCGADVNITSARTGTTLDFTAAPVVRLDIQNVTGITVKGVVSTGAPYSALNLINTHQMLIAHPKIIRPGTAGITIQGSDTVEVDGPWITESSGTGVDVAGSTNVNIHDGGCENNAVTKTVAECVDMWSATNHPLIHVFVQNMLAIGKTQGFDALDRLNYGATDVEILNNHAAISTANCVAASFINHLIVTGNDCHTMPGATSAPTINVTNSPGAVMSGNSPGVSPQAG